jgi:hypothetical protein
MLSEPLTQAKKGKRKLDPEAIEEKKAVWQVLPNTQAAAVRSQREREKAQGQERNERGERRRQLGGSEGHGSSGQKGSSKESGSSGQGASGGDASLSMARGGQDNGDGQGSDSGQAGGSGQGASGGHASPWTARGDVGSHAGPSHVEEDDEPKVYRHGGTELCRQGGTELYRQGGTEEDRQAAAEMDADPTGYYSGGTEPTLAFKREDIYVEIIDLED